ncbi:hypothetical protein BDV95DRAFT_600621 [Massariosphaeria phaeospora]|uniref:Uncharacterized protein n=1 Tax=Massariosphaeria phaeospora TaxID=100035 RepID=A0A7C8IMG3_9PLEO|nr:hypothetical protein BDV95DRAFT_600621 [Massariosphaeria phaeospora]
MDEAEAARAALRDVAVRNFGDDEYAIENYLSATTKAFQHYEQQQTALDKVFQNIANIAPDCEIAPIEECRAQAREDTREIEKWWTVLGSLLITYEDHIRKRWLRKSIAQRKQILLKVWPDINRIHRPDLPIYETTHLKPDPDLVATHGWPYIDLEDLSRPKALLMFLNSRGRHLSDKFAHSDLELAPLFKQRKEFVALRRDQYSMAFIGRGSGDGNGKFVYWNDRLGLTRSINNGLTVSVDHGLQILQIQSHILKFLAGCGLRIVRDLIGKMALPKELLQRPKPFPLSHDEISVSTLSNINRDAPYRPPADLDSVRLQSLVSAQRAQAIDYVWALREDPGFFADTVQDYRDHRPELILDHLGREHRNATDFPLYNEALRHMTTDAYALVFLWNKIQSRIIRLHNLSIEHSNEIHPNKNLPQDLFELLVNTRFLLEALSLDLIDTIKCLFSASPPVRSFHTRTNFDGPNPDKVTITRQFKFEKDDKSRDRALKLLWMLGNKGVRDHFTTHILLDELEGYLENHPRGKSFISPLIAT